MQILLRSSAQSRPIQALALTILNLLEPGDLARPEEPVLVWAETPYLPRVTNMLWPDWISPATFCERWWPFCGCNLSLFGRLTTSYTIIWHTHEISRRERFWVVYLADGFIAFFSCRGHAINSLPTENKLSHFVHGGQNPQITNKLTLCINETSTGTVSNCKFNTKFDSINWVMNSCTVSNTGCSS
jgi:hypothetical protein